MLDLIGDGVRGGRIFFGGLALKELYGLLIGRTSRLNFIRSSCRSLLLNLVMRFRVEVGLRRFIIWRDR